MVHSIVRWLFGDGGGGHSAFQGCPLISPLCPEAPSPQERGVRCGGLRTQVTGMITWKKGPRVLFSKCSQWSGKLQSVLWREKNADQFVPEILPPPNVVFIMTNLKFTTRLSLHKNLLWTDKGLWSWKGQRAWVWNWGSKLRFETKLNIYQWCVWPWAKTVKAAAIYIDCAVIPWNSRGTVSRTPQVPKSKDAQFPYIKCCGTIHTDGPLHAQIPNRGQKQYVWSTVGWIWGCESHEYRGCNLSATFHYYTHYLL